MGQGFAIRAKGQKSAEILIYEDIGEGYFNDGITALDFTKQLKALGSVDQLDVRINSYGGNVSDGTVIYNRLKDHPARVVSYIDGVAASVASVIAMAGDEIIIAENAWMMIHDAWGLAMGNAADLRRQADLMDSQSAVMADLYAARTKYPKDKVRQMMTDETWMSSADAIKYGFASSISENMRVAAHAKAGAMYGFRHLPSMLGGKASTEPDDAEKALRARASQRAQRVQQARLQQSFRQRATQPTNGAST